MELLRRLLDRARASCGWLFRRMKDAGAATAILALATIGLAIMAYRTDETTREALVSVQRAFVFPRTIELVPTKNDAGDAVVSWFFYPVWENSGNTPTIDLRIFI